MSIFAARSWNEWLSQTWWIAFGTSLYWVSIKKNMPGTFCSVLVLLLTKFQRVQFSDIPFFESKTVMHCVSITSTTSWFFPSYEWCVCQLHCAVFPRGLFHCIPIHEYRNLEHILVVFHFDWVIIFSNKKAGHAESWNQSKYHLIVLWHVLFWRGCWWNECWQNFLFQLPEQQKSQWGEEGSELICGGWMEPKIKSRVVSMRKLAKSPTFTSFSSFGKTCKQNLFSLIQSCFSGRDDMNFLQILANTLSFFVAWIGVVDIRCFTLMIPKIVARTSCFLQVIGV